MAQAIEFHLAGLAEDGELVPSSSLRAAEIIVRDPGIPSQVEA